MCSRVLLALLATLLVTSCKDTENNSSAPPAGAAGPETLYVLGSTIHLRKAPSPEGESLDKPRIGTPCTPLAPAQGEWRKVRCGDKEGYASVALLGPEKPSVEKLRAEAKDPQRPLAQREDAALRAAMLSPEDATLHQELGDLFFEQLAAVKKPLKSPKLDYPCLTGEEPTHCITSSAGPLGATRRRAVTKGKAFVLALGDGEQIFVYRGRFGFDKKNKLLTEQVLERTRFASTPVMEQALFAGLAAEDAGADSPRLGQLVLDAASQALLEKLASPMWLLRPSDEHPQLEWRDACTRQSYALTFRADVHGRWSMAARHPEAALPDERWVSAVSKTEHGTTLTLARTAEDSEPQHLEVAQSSDVPSLLGGASYGYPSTFDDNAAADTSRPCVSTEGRGPSFPGEFLPDKAMAALYGHFDAASGTSTWRPTLAERERMQDLEQFRTERYQALPWKWKPYREGEQERMLFLTETRAEPAGHPTPALIGGGIFARTQDGWRLARAFRVLRELGSFGVAPGYDISVQGVGAGGFVAVLPSGYTSMGQSSCSLLLLSDVGGEGSLREVATMEDTCGSNEGACVYHGPDDSERDEAMPECYSFDSTWTFAPHEGNALPDFVLTTEGARRDEERPMSPERFRDVRIYSVSMGQRQYAESSHAHKRL